MMVVSSGQTSYNNGACHIIYKSYNGIGAVVLIPTMDQNGYQLSRGALLCG